MARVVRVSALIALVAASLRADTLLVLNKRDATLAFIDPMSMKVLAKIPTGEGPHEVASSEDGKIAKRTRSVRSSRALSPPRQQPRQHQPQHPGRDGHISDIEDAGVQHPRV